MFRVIYVTKPQKLPSAFTPSSFEIYIVTVKSEQLRVSLPSASSAHLSSVEPYRRTRNSGTSLPFPNAPTVGRPGGRKCDIGSSVFLASPWSATADAMSPKSVIVLGRSAPLYRAFLSFHYLPTHTGVEYPVAPRVMHRH